MDGVAHRRRGEEGDVAGKERGTRREEDQQKKVFLLSLIWIKEILEKKSRNF
jgi:hypothetical protein